MAKNEFIIDLKKLNLSDTERKSLNNAIHDTVAKKIRSLKKEKTAKSGAKPVALAAAANGVKATLKITFTKVDLNLSNLTATCMSEAKTINQSGNIAFDNVRCGKKIKIKGNSLGFTTVTIDIDADPTQLNFDKGKINGEFFIN